MVIKKSPGGRICRWRAVNFEIHLCSSGVTAFGDRPASSLSKFSASVKTDLGNGSFWFEIGDAEHVYRCSWKCRRVWSYQLTFDLRAVYLCVIVVTIRGWADVGWLVAVCFPAKNSLHIKNHVCTLDTVTGYLAVNSVFITFRSMWETKKFSFFSLFKTLFYTKLPFPLSWWSKDLLVENLQVADGQLRNPPV